MEGDQILAKGLFLGEGLETIILFFYQCGSSRAKHWKQQSDNKGRHPIKSWGERLGFHHMDVDGVSSTVATEGQLIEVG